MNGVSDAKAESTTDQKRNRYFVLHRPRGADRLEGLRLCGDPYIESVLRLALATGIRRGELLAIRAEQIDLAARALLIPNSKNGWSRHIPLSSDAINTLRSLLPAEGRLFPITGNGFRLAWERLKRRAGIEDLHFHDLRHEAISRFFEMGLSVPEVALISGHREIRMLFRYTHPMRQGIIGKMDAAQAAPCTSHA